MSYTNQTQHYGLPQYVGTDVPAWLTDINGAFATIDQGMNAAKTQADSAATAAGQAANDIVSINSTLGTQAGQISAAANAAAAAQTTANTADGKADTNAQSISGLDTRVTALEQGGGGGGGLEIEEIQAPFVAGVADITSLIPIGKRPFAVSLLTVTGVSAEQTAYCRIEETLRPDGTIIFVALMRYVSNNGVVAGDSGTFRILVA